MGKYFGTDGFRGEANKNLTFEHAIKIGRFLGWYYGKNQGKKGGLIAYLKGVRQEFRKVVWPTRKQVVNNTGVVLSIMVVVALFLFGVDSGLGAAIQAILKIGA